MAQKKLKRFREIKTFPNVLEYPVNMRGRWKEIFGNENEIILELACGKGEYATGLARIYPRKNLIGVDIIGNRLWVGAKLALEEKLSNVFFLRTQIDKIATYFLKDEVSEIWITFPDPQLRLSKTKKRLTHPRFLRLYQQIMKPDGKIHLKTDSPDLYRFTKTVIDLYHLPLIEDLQNIHSQKNLSDELKIKTHYEGLDIAKSEKIFYLSFHLTDVIEEEDKLLLNILKERERKE